MLTAFIVFSMAFVVCLITAIMSSDKNIQFIMPFVIILVVCCGFSFLGCLYGHKEIVKEEYIKPKILFIDKDHVVVEYRDTFYKNHTATFVNNATEENVYILSQTYKNHFGITLTSFSELSLVLKTDKSEE